MKLGIPGVLTGILVTAGVWVAFTGRGPGPATTPAPAVSVTAPTLAAARHAPDTAGPSATYLVGTIALIAVGVGLLAWFVACAARRADGLGERLFGGLNVTQSPPCPPRRWHCILHQRRTGSTDWSVVTHGYAVLPGTREQIQAAAVARAYATLPPGREYRAWVTPAVPATEERFAA